MKVLRLKNEITKNISKIMYRIYRLLQSNGKLTMYVYNISAKIHISSTERKRNPPYMSTL